jgi:enoyl-CoA hydratase
MGAFLLLSADYRVGARGPFKIGANEVALGMTMPFFAIELCRYRLTPGYFDRSVNNAEIHTPEDAVVAGFLDRTIEASEVLATARAVATELRKLSAPAHAATKRRSRAQVLDVLRRAIELDANASLPG